MALALFDLKRVLSIREDWADKRLIQKNWDLKKLLRVNPLKMETRVSYSK